MTPIKLNSKLADTRLNEVLAVEQGRCTARTLSADKIRRILGRIQDQISIPAKYLSGVCVEYDGAQKFPSAYKFRPESTYFTATHDGRTWIITSIGRSTCPNRINNTTVQLTPEAKEKIAERFQSMEI